MERFLAAATTENYMAEVSLSFGPIWKVLSWDNEQSLHDQILLLTLESFLVGETTQNCIAEVSFCGQLESFCLQQKK